MTRLMSFCTRPTVAAKKAVIAPMTMTTESAAGAYSKIGESRATMKTPAVTIVAAWISAETGVGPSIASGSQVCSRNCADLPIAPMKRSRQASVSACHSMPRKRKCAVGEFGDAREDLSKATLPNRTKTRKMPSDEAEIADAVDDERLDRRGVGGGLLVPEADEQIAREADALPAEEHLDEVVGRHQHQHGEGEEREIGEEARPVRILVHVADRIEMHERGDGVDDDEHHHRQRVDPERPVDTRSPEAIHSATWTRVAPEPKPTWKNATQESAAATNRSAVVTISLGAGSDEPPEEAGDQKADEREEDDRVIHAGLQPLIMLTSSTAMVPRLRKKTTRMARPIAASAAATVRIRSAKTWPTMSPR